MFTKLLSNIVVRRAGRESLPSSGNGRSKRRFVFCTAAAIKNKATVGGASVSLSYSAEAWHSRAEDAVLGRGVVGKEGSCDVRPPFGRATVQVALGSLDRELSWNSLPHGRGGFCGLVPQ